MKKYQVLVRLKEGVLDVQGKAVESGLADCGVTSVSNVRVGKVVEFDINGLDEQSARQQVEKMCRDILANTVIEQFEIREQ